MRIMPTGERTRLLVSAVALRNGSDWVPVSGLATLTVDGQLLGVQAGDRLQVFGTLRRPSSAENPGGFDRASYLRASRQLCGLWASHPDCVTVVEPARHRGIRWWIERVRTDARRTLWGNLAPGRAELASAVLLGAREEIDSEETNVFVETGTVHLLAISGLHVGIVAGVLLMVLRTMSLSQATEFCIVVGWTIAYTLLTDARPPAIRATILVAVLCFARLKRRPASPWNSLAGAGLIVAALNPADLFSTGVHLSFLAVATLMCVSPRWFLAARSEDPLDRLIERSRSPWERAVRWTAVKVLRLLVASTAVWLITLPLVASRFHVVSLGAVLLNMVVWIPMAVALVTGFLMILSGWFLPPAVPWLARFCDDSLWALQGMIEAGHRLPGNPVFVAGPPDWWLIGFYVLLAAAVWMSKHLARRRRWAWALVALWLVSGAVVGHRFAPRDRLVCTIVSVGHGSAAILELPGGPVMLCDAGRMGSPTGGARDIAGCLWARKIRRLDAILLSHADADHFNAVPELLRRFAVGTVYTPPGVLDGERGAAAALRRTIEGHGVAIRQVVTGDRFRVGEAAVEVLHPPEASFAEHDNAASMVLSVEYAGRRIILPGDVDESGLDALLASPRRPCDVLLAPHHGSLKTDAPGLAAWCSPRWVIVSGYREPRIEPVARTYRAAGAEVLYTGDVGAVRVTMDCDGVRVETHPGKGT
jgi:competence protein ComEC